jgi:tetratricopeptide (TPR) repeat protein
VPAWSDGRDEALARHATGVAEAEAAGRWPAAMEHLEALVAAEPDRADLRLRRARALAEAGYRARAEADYREALAMPGIPKEAAINGDWWVAGPYPDDFQALDPPDPAVDPSRPAGSPPAGRRWRPAPVSADGHLDLGSIFGGAEHISGYVLAAAYSPARHKAALLVGSDDGVRAWINGKLVVEDGGEHRASPRQHCVAADLRAGRNVVCARIVNVTEGHEVYLKLSTEPDDLCRAYAAAGRPGEVAEAFGALASRHADDPRLRYEFALSLVDSGDLAGYRTACAALSRFDGARRAETAGQIARALALAPGATDDLESAVRLAAKAVKESPRVAWWLYVAGLAEYRAGRPESAIVRLKEAASADPDWASSALIRPVLAMAYLGSGRRREAETTLGEARAVSGTVGGDIPWWDRVEFRLLLREAEARIGGGPAR